MSATDQAYASVPFVVPELAHHYGAQVHLLADPLALTLLARLGSPDCVQPEVSRLVRALYRGLAGTVLAAELPRRPVAVTTRMRASTPRGVWHGEAVAAATPLVTVDIARAGTLPSQVLFETAAEVLAAAGVRQDHIYMSRVCDDAGRVTGVAVAGSKIGGPVADAIVVVPDPMGATGGSLCRVAAMYKALPGGAPRRLVALNLVVTPEYLAALRAQHPDVVVYALRLDRGMSAAPIFSTALGARWPEERGLDDRQYIVPGAGGLGEVLNNSHV